MARQIWLKEYLRRGRKSVCVCVYVFLCVCGCMWICVCLCVCLCGCVCACKGGGCANRAQRKEIALVRADMKTNQPGVKPNRVSSAAGNLLWHTREKNQTFALTVTFQLPEEIRLFLLYFHFLSDGGATPGTCMKGVHIKVFRKMILKQCCGHI